LTAVLGLGALDPVEGSAPEMESEPSSRAL